MTLDFAVTYLVKEKMRANRFLANGLGFLCGATNNWFFNRLWTFESSNPNVGQEYATFVLVASGGLAINSAMLWLLNVRLGLPFYFSKLGAVSVAVFWNFTGNYLVTFAQG